MDQFCDCCSIVCFRKCVHDMVAIEKSALGLFVCFVFEMGFSVQPWLYCRSADLELRETHLSAPSFGCKGMHQHHPTEWPCLKRGILMYYLKSAELIGITYI